MIGDYPEYHPEDDGYLMAFEEIDLVFAGVNDEGQTLYERIV